MQYIRFRRAALVGAAVMTVAAATLLAGCSSSRNATAGRGAAGPAVESPTAGTGTPRADTSPSDPGRSSPASHPAEPARSSSGAVGGQGSSSVAIPAPAMLQLPDVRPWNRLAISATGVSAVKQTEPSACEEHTAFPSDRHRVAVRTVGYDMPEPESGGVWEAVVRYEPGWAREAMAEARRVLAACPRYLRSFSAQDREEVRYVLEGTLPGTGDEAMLIRRETQRVGDTRVFSLYLSVARVGDAVLTTSHEVGEGVADRDLAIALAGAGARRAACLRASC